MQPSRLFIGLLFSAVWCLHTPVPSAWAASDTLTVANPVEHYVLYVHEKRPALISVSSPIIGKAEPEGWKVGVKVHSTADAVTLVVPKDASADELRGELTIRTRLYTLVITVLGADTLKQAKSPILVQHKGLLQVVQAAAAHEAQERIAAAEERMAETMRLATEKHARELAVKETEHQRILRKVRQENGELALLREHSGTAETVEFARSAHCSRSGAVSVCPVRWDKLDERAVLRFEVFNGTSGTAEINKFEAFGQGQTENLAGAVRIGDQAPMPQGTARTTLRSMQRITASVIVRDARTVGQQVQLLLTGPSIRPAVSYIDLRPKPGEGLITLSLQGIAGAVWLANPVDPGTLGATSSVGAEMRVRYGINKLLSFEGALAWARSGIASWDGMTFNNQDGILSRDATVGRVLAFGLLHFGEKYRPLVRAGLGFQGVSHGSRFTPAGGVEQSGPEVDFELAGLWAFGLGFEAKLGHHWTAGVGATFVGVATSTNSLAGLKTSFEGGFQLSYGWTPGY